MKTLSVTEVVRNFSKTIDRVAGRKEEIILIRNGRPVARIVPEVPSQTALEIFGDLHRTLDDKTPEALASALARAKKSRRGRVSELRNPWVG